jgi:hypothetical protein
VAQVHAGMWVRNGTSMLHIVDQYTNWVEDGRDSDLFLIQCAAAMLPAEAFVRRVEEAFGLQAHLTLDEAGPQCEFAPRLTEELLVLLMALCVERGGCGLSDRACIRRDLVQVSAFAEKPFENPFFCGRLETRVVDFKHRIETPYWMVGSVRGLKPS